MTTVYVDDVVAWLRGREWLVQSGFMPRYHAVLCDPPYGLAFMGQHWDTMTAEQYQAWCTEWATLLLSFVYPGDVVDGIEQSAEYADIARARLAWWSQFSSYEQARSAAGADEREAAEREQARALGVEQLALFDSAGEAW